MFTGKEKYSVSKQRSIPESSIVMAFLEFVLCYDLSKLTIYLSSYVALQTGDMIWFCWCGIPVHFGVPKQNWEGVNPTSE